MKPRALVRAFNLLLTFDTDKKDKVIEQEARELIDKINEVLAQEFPGPIPQIEIENPKKKMKLGVKLYSRKELEEYE